MVHANEIVREEVVASLRGEPRLIMPESDDAVVLQDPLRAEAGLFVAADDAEVGGDLQPNSTGLAILLHSDFEDSNDNVMNVPAEPAHYFGALGIVGLFGSGSTHSSSISNSSESTQLANSVLLDPEEFGDELTLG